MQHALGLPLATTWATAGDRGAPTLPVNTLHRRPKYSNPPWAYAHARTHTHTHTHTYIYIYIYILFYLFID